MIYWYLVLKLIKKIFLTPRFALTIFCWLLVFISIGQMSNLRFHQLTIKEGLSQSSVFSFTQDQFGNIWLGTQDGLNSFDGYDVAHYKHQLNDRNSLSSSYILSTYEDYNGYLWVGTENGGLNYKKPLEDVFHRIDNSLLNNNVSIVEIIGDKNGFLWIGTEESGIFKFCLNDDSLVHFHTGNGLLSNKISSLSIIDNKLIIGTSNLGLAGIDLTKKNVIVDFSDWNQKINNLSINDIDVYNDSLIYIATNDGVKLIKPYSKEQVYDLTESLNNKVIQAIFCQNPNKIWAGSNEEGLFSIDIITSDLNKIKKQDHVLINNYQHNEFDRTTLNSNMVYDIAQDFSGTIWISSQDGVSYFDPLKQNFDLFTNRLGGEQSLNDKNIWSIYEESDNIVWVGNRKGLSRINLADNQTYNYPFFSDSKLIFANNSIWDIYVDKEKGMLLGTNSGIFRFVPSEDFKTGEFYRYRPENDSTNQPIYDINADIDGCIWASGKNNLFKYSKNIKVFKSDLTDINKLPNAPCRRIFFSNNGNVWLGYEGRGACELQKLDNDNYKVQRYVHDENNKNTISNNTVLSIAEDNNGNIWLATMGGGLNRYDLTKKQFTYYTEKDGLSNNAIYGLIIDDKGKIWMSTNFGISQFDPEDNKFRNFNEGNGLQSNEFNNNAYYQNESGKIFFGGINGFNYFYPNNIKINNIPPKPLITEIKWLIEGKFQNYLRDKHPYLVDSISLTFFHNDLSFSFKGLHFSDPKSNQYKIHLEGLYEDSVLLKNTRSINYSNLPAGEYTFKVWTSNLDGIWSPPRQIKISVTPPFWYTWEFYVMLAVVSILTFFLIYVIRVKAIKRQQRRLAFLVERRTKTITKQKEQIERQTKKIEKEKEKADKLLLNILPSETVDELKNKGIAKPRQYRTATVMFTDIKDFSKVAETMAPSRLLQSLDNLFREFDRIIEKHHLEKIKTMGDAYMAAGGLPLRDKENPINCVLAALEIQQFMGKLKHESIAKGEGFWELRIGIHTGDVIAGVIGSKRIAYDIWGSTVNIAQRIETSGETWKVNISASTFDHISPYFKCISRGKIPTKNTGEISMYFVESIKPHLSKGGFGISQNKKFREYIDLHLYSSINYKKAERHIMKVLKEGLPENLHYHGIHHTYDVVRAVERIAIMEGVMDDDIFVLKSAATYHDAGFVERYDNNEPVGAKLAEDILPKYGYTEDQIEVVKKLIYATIIPHNPKSKLEKIICDADLDYLGRDDFFEISDSLRRELRDHGKIKSDKLWDEIQVKFLTMHKYFTKSAIKMREQKKAEHLQVIKDRLKADKYDD